MKKGLTNEVKERVEAIEGMDIAEAAKRRYVGEERGFRWLAAHWGVNSRTVRRILASCGIAVRHGSEAVATQWRGNAERRKKAGMCLAQTNHRLAMEGKHVRQGKTKENSAMMRNIAERLRTTSAFNRADVRAAAVARSICTRRAHPERMSALRKPLSEVEKVMARHLSAISLPFEVNVLFAPFYVADFYVPSLRLVVDCQGRNRFPLSYERHKSLTAEGRRVAYCMNEFVKSGVFSSLDDYIARVKVARRDPSSVCEESMIFGACGHRPFGDNANKLRLHTSGVRGRYLTEVSAAPED